MLTVKCHRQWNCMRRLYRYTPHTIAACEHHIDMKHNSTKVFDKRFIYFKTKQQRS